MMPRSGQYEDGYLDPYEEEKERRDISVEIKKNNQRSEEMYYTWRCDRDIFTPSTVENYYGMNGCLPPSSCQSVNGRVYRQSDPYVSKKRGEYHDYLQSLQKMPSVDFHGNVDYPTNAWPRPPAEPRVGYTGLYMGEDIIPLDGGNDNNDYNDEYADDATYTSIPHGNRSGPVVHVTVEMPYPILHGNDFDGRHDTEVYPNYEKLYNNTFRRPKTANGGRLKNNKLDGGRQFVREDVYDVGVLPRQQTHFTETTYRTTYRDPTVPDPTSREVHLKCMVVW